MPVITNKASLVPITSFIRDSVE